MTSKLTKSVRTYRRRLHSVDVRRPRSQEYRDTLDYLRQLYGEHGQRAVEAENERQKR